MADPAGPAMALTPGLAVDVGSGVLLLALAAWVLALRPRRGVNVALASFAATLGLAFVASNLADASFLAGRGLVIDPPPEVLAINAASFGAASLGVVLLGLAFPRPLREPRLAVVPALFAAGYVGVLLGVFGVPLTFLVYNPVLLLRGALLFTVALLWVRAASARGPGADRERRTCALLAGALVLWPGVLTGAEVFVSPTRGRVVAGAGLAALGALAAAWLVVAARAPPGQARAPRDAALLTLAAPLVGMVAAGTWGFLATIDGGLMGTARTVAVLLIAWGILRQQLLGIDLGVKRTLRQSTVAAAFVGVFFVVSEAASEFFATGASLGPYLGIVAAGALVFALAPVQRLAERVANAALPGVEASPAYFEFKRFDLYRSALANAGRDGVVTPGERAILEGLREQLGLSRADAEALEREVARGPGHGSDPGPGFAGPRGAA